MGAVKAGKPVRLQTLFARYLLTACLTMAALALLWWTAFMAVMNSGWVMPAYTASVQAGVLAQRIEEEGVLEPDGIPHYIRWAVFSLDGELTAHAAMKPRRLEQIRRAASEGRLKQGLLYTQYHRIVPLDGGGMAVLQYDYAVPYKSARLAAYLPDFQSMMLVVLAGLLGGAAALHTRRYARLLREDAQRLTQASRAIADRSLEAAVLAGTHAAELGEALQAMETLRLSLAESLDRQFVLEQERRREIASLAHDLKTPLAVILGNAELLEEEKLPEGSAQRVRSIGSAAERMQASLRQLQALSSQMDAGEARMQRVNLAALAEVLNAQGAGLCAARRVRFIPSAPPQGEAMLDREAVMRAALNLLDNAVRYAGPGGSVSLSLAAENGLLSLTVRDSGPGFSDEALRLAGRAFYTEEKHRSSGGHAGMGLCYAAQTALRHGGVLTLQNDSGAVARITLGRIAESSTA